HSSSLRCTAPATHSLYTLSLHDALPIFVSSPRKRERHHDVLRLQFHRFTPSRQGAKTAGRRAISSVGRASRLHREGRQFEPVIADRKSTRLNSSHVKISYAVFCLKRKII